ncbi:unnamed protein product [Calypogeia fissa]
MSSTWRCAQFVLYLALLHLLLSNVHSGRGRKQPILRLGAAHRRILSIEDHVYFSQTSSKRLAGAAAVLHTSIRTDVPAPPPQQTALAPASSTAGLTSGLAPNAATPTVTSSSAPSSNPSPGQCCAPNTILLPWINNNNCSCVYPIEIGLLLDNARITIANWSMKFQQQLGDQLNLTTSQVLIRGVQFENSNSNPEINITVDVAPSVGESFSPDAANSMEAHLKNHDVILDPQLFGNYSLQSFIVFGPNSGPVNGSPSPPGSPLGDGQSPSAFNSSGGSNNSSLPLIIGVALGGLVLVIVLAGLFWRFVFLGRKKDFNKLIEPARAHSKVSTMTRSSLSDVPSTDVHTVSSTKIFIYDDLREATNNFDPATLLGEGGFGRVYRGVLKDGTEVAIKKLSTGGHQGDREFLVEVEMLSRLHHRHLVKLVGYFSSRDTRTQLLCYELVPNGSLEAWLHGHLGVHRPLDWEKRVKIAIGSARGLAYLHEDSQPCVIHRDFKASNILLEYNFTAKVADFGLAKQAPEGQGNYVSTRVMGTFGYVAPEYAMTGHLLVKSDVYSYGVVLLELLSGRKPVDMSQPSGQENLVTWARPLLKDKDRLSELADPRLFGRYPKEDFAQVAAIAAACVAPEASQRPTMGEVVQSLKLVQRSRSEFDSRDERTPTSASASQRSFTVSWQNTRPTSTTFESDDSSTMFSSGPVSGLVGVEGENLSRTTVISEDLQEGR